MHEVEATWDYCSAKLCHWLARLHTLTWHVKYDRQHTAHSQRTASGMGVLCVSPLACATCFSASPKKRDNKSF